jgi:hypothetical protein
MPDVQQRSERILAAACNERTETPGLPPQPFAIHVLPASGTLVGVCMTVLSIVKLLRLGPQAWMIDKPLALASIAFLISSLLSYASMRSGGDARLERFADGAFLLGLLLLTACVIVMTLFVD